MDVEGEGGGGGDGGGEGKGELEAGTRLHGYLRHSTATPMPTLGIGNKNTNGGVERQKAGVHLTLGQGTSGNRQGN